MFAARARKTAREGACAPRGPHAPPRVAGCALASGVGGRTPLAEFPHPPVARRFSARARKTAPEGGCAPPLTSPLHFPPLLTAFLLLCLAATLAPARTITLKPDALDAFAVLAENHPRNGWAAQPIDASLYLSNPPLAAPNTSFIVRYSFAQLPPGQRITHAEWIIPGGAAAAGTVTVWRVIADWGIGVSHQFRMAYPKPLPWSVPGARGKSIDRATKPTGTGKFSTASPQVTVNVTQDVELWHTGAAPNRGWLLTFDSASLLVSPTHGGRSQWQLRITYEPE